MSRYGDIAQYFWKQLNSCLPIEFDLVLKDNLAICTAQELSVFIYFPGTTRQAPSQERKTIHLDIDQVIHHTTKIIYRIKGLLGFGNRIHARATVVARLDKLQALEFQEDHHLQVALPGKYRYGLFYQGDLVSVAIFSGGRRMNDQHENYRSFELLRFCHKRDYSIVGGISKLIKAFVADFSPGDIMTYADLDWCQDSSLTKIGFHVVGQTNPQEFWINDTERLYSQPVDTSSAYLVRNSGSLKLKKFFTDK